MAALEESGAYYGSGVVWGKRLLTVEARGGCEAVYDSLTLYSGYVHFIVLYFVS